MKLYYLFLALIMVCSNTLYSCPTGIDCDDEDEIALEHHDPYIGTDLILTP